MSAAQERRHGFALDEILAKSVAVAQAQEERGLPTGRSAGELGTEVATSGGWLLLADLTRQLRRLPPWSTIHPLLLPGAVLFALSGQVGAYFGVPSALLHGMAVALLAGHLWPSWRAREIADHWTPTERYLRVAVSADGLTVESAGFTEKVPSEEIRVVQGGAEGWLLALPRRPPLWIARAGFSELHGEAAARIFARLPRAVPARVGLGWMYVGAGGASVVATALWYFSA